VAQRKVDVLLVGAGVMSATLGKLLSELDSGLKVLMVERLSKVASESSHVLNNAGTGHAGNCELNYTPQEADGSIKIDKALEIGADFEVSLQFWSYLVDQGCFPDPTKFINPVWHQSFVWGKDNVAFLRQRFETMRQHQLFEEMEYSEDRAVLNAWMPLVLQGRDPQQRVAATRVKNGSDVDFGFLTRKLVRTLQKSPNFELKMSHTIETLRQRDDGRWHVRMKENATGKSHTINAGFVFIGAGGGALPLLQKSGAPEGEGYGGFPVSGQWLICRKPEIVRQHATKVYGKAPVGAPPMSVPHLDVRVIDGERALLFGPFASVTTKFLKQGSVLDLFTSLKTDNFKPMLAVALDNFDLMRYLMGEAMKSHKDRVEALRAFYPLAREEDWELASAGQRVQIIKSCGAYCGQLAFGTEIVTSKDGTLATLLGASPGASTAVQAMIGVIERCFKPQMKTAAWKHKMKEMIPSYGESLIENAALAQQVRQFTMSTLRLDGKSRGVDKAG
jgi:malate dehydrogenase (quinone)